MALVTAVALAAVSAFFGVTGMTAIFAATAIPMMVIIDVLDAAKPLRHGWRGTGGSRRYCCADRSS
jgi:hypothetical protein